MRIFIVGYMLSGKSTIGKRLARLLNYKFIDTDKAIEQQYKLSVSDIFKKYGEEVFRILEKQMINTLKEEENIVISTGGGFVCFNDNMKWVKENYPECLLVGPCTVAMEASHEDGFELNAGGIVGMMGDNCTTDELMDGATQKFDVYSYHYYNGISDRLASVVPSMHWDPERTLSEAYLKVASLSAKASYFS